MKDKIMKIMLIAIGIIPFIWLFIISFDDYINIRNYLIDVLLNISQYPFVLLGLIPIFIGNLISSRNSQKSHLIKKKTLWRFILIVGIIPFVIPIALSIFSFFEGVTIFSFTISKGVTRMFELLLFWSFLFWPTYIIGIILITLSIIKLKKRN